MFASKICFLTCLLVIVQQPIASAQRKTLRFTKSYTDIPVESAQKNSVEAVAEDVKEHQSAEPHALLESQKESKASGPYGGYGYGNGYNTYSSSSSTSTAPEVTPADIVMRWGGFNLWHFLMAMLYYFRIVKKYPKLESTPPTPESQQLQRESPLEALSSTSCPNIFLSCCCFQERAAQTFDAAGVLDYWPACLVMMFFPCCTLWMVSSCTDLKEKLGGEKYNCCKGCLCASCCGCCMVAQDAESLDRVTRAKTEFFDVAGVSRRQVVPQVAAQQAVMAAPAPVTTSQ